jgi:hypothetical protein
VVHGELHDVAMAERSEDLLRALVAGRRPAAERPAAVEVP